jgi:hypothetical protein
VRFNMQTKTLGRRVTIILNDLGKFVRELSGLAAPAIGKPTFAVKT